MERQNMYSHWDRSNNWSTWTTMCQCRKLPFQKKNMHWKVNSSSNKKSKVNWQLLHRYPIRVRWSLVTRCVELHRRQCYCQAKAGLVESMIIHNSFRLRRITTWMRLEKPAFRVSRIWNNVQPLVRSSEVWGTVDLSQYQLYMKSWKRSLHFSVFSSTRPYICCVFLICCVCCRLVEQ